MKEEIPGLIKYKEAKALHENWLETRGEIIKDALGFEESYEVNFSATELLKYIAYVIESSKEQGVDNPGVRILFGSYDGKENLLKKDNKTNATIVMIPTLEDSPESSCNREIDALNRAHTGWPPIGL